MGAPPPIGSVGPARFRRESDHSCQFRFSVSADRRAVTEPSFCSGYVFSEEPDSIVVSLPLGISLFKIGKLVHGAYITVPESDSTEFFMDAYLDRIAPEKLAVLCSSGFFLDDRRLTFIDEYGAELSIEEVEENNVRWLKRRIGEVGQ